MISSPPLPEPLWGPLRQALQRIAEDQGIAEHRDDPTDGHALRMFMPTARFDAALAPDVFLVTGDRGAGKTELFRALASAGRDLLDHKRRAVVGFGLRRGHYDMPGVDALTEALRGADLGRLRAFWLALLARALRTELPDLSGDLPTLLSQKDPSKLIQAGQTHAVPLMTALDALDARLQLAGETLSVLYDDLDQILPIWDQLMAPLRGLFALWQTCSRTWRRLRPKIFLRKDLFESDLLAFPDGAKFFAARMVTLS